MDTQEKRKPGRPQTHTDAERGKRALEAQKRYRDKKKAEHASRLSVVGGATPNSVELNTNQREASS